MNWPALIDLFRQYHEAILTGIGGLAGWYGQVMKDRLQRQRNVIDAEQLENEQLALALNRERFLTDRLTVQGQEAEMLWRRLYERERVIKEYHSAALSAQRQVNELEIRGGLPETVFPDLPDFPPEDGRKAEHPATERGEHYDDADGNKTGRPPGSTVGRWEKTSGQKGDRPTEGS
ncbi:hypothetical protein GM609_01595 [Bombella sp. ESL0387]|nr:hypothetical protein [Bombella sp. ESL0387]